MFHKRELIGTYFYDPKSKLSDEYKLKFITEHMDEYWDFKWVSRNLAVTEDFVLQYLDRPWDFKCLEKRGIISEDSKVWEMLLGQNPLDVELTRRCSLLFEKQIRGYISGLGRTGLPPDLIKHIIEHIW